MTMFDGIRAWFLGAPKYRFDFASAKRTCRILLIDDDSTALPLAEVKRDEYNIEQYKNVDPDLLRQCENGVFDVIILDYNGVAPASITPDDGFGVFDRIRGARPEQYIISVSAQTYDISKTAYFKNANDWLKKPTDLTTTKNKLDAAIRYLFDKSAVLERLRAQMLSDGFKQKSIDRVVNHLNSKTYTDLEQLSELVKRVGHIAQISEHLYALLRVLVRLSVA
jgi:DNA-binding response OmpR family regulator